MNQSDHKLHCMTYLETNHCKCVYVWTLRKQRIHIHFRLTCWEKLRSLILCTAGKNGSVVFLLFYNLGTAKIGQECPPSIVYEDIFLAWDRVPECNTQKSNKKNTYGMDIPMNYVIGVEIPEPFSDIYDLRMYSNNINMEGDIMSSLYLRGAPWRPNLKDFQRDTS